MRVIQAGSSPHVFATSPLCVLALKLPKNCLSRKATHANLPVPSTHIDGGGFWDIPTFFHHPASQSLGGVWNKWGVAQNPPPSMCVKRLFITGGAAVAKKRFAT